MKKIFVLLALIICSPVFAEPLPIKITPAQIISTTNNEIETGDKIRFKTVNDVYYKKNLYIKKDTSVIGIVDHIAENGWAYDNAQIEIKTFKTRDVNGNIVTINSDLSINGFEILKYKSKRFAQFFNYCGVVWRGKEVEILPEQENLTFNIWLAK